MICTSRRRVKLKGRKRTIAYKSNGRCWYCGNTFHGSRATKDHQTPKSQGGLGMPDNLVLACVRCNHEKADMSVETYRWYLQQRKAAGERIIFYGERCVAINPWYS